MADPANNTGIVAYPGEDIKSLPRSYNVDMDTSLKILKDEFAAVGDVAHGLQMIDALENLNTLPSVTFSAQSSIPEVSDVRDAVLHTLFDIKCFEEEGKRLFSILERQRRATDDMVSELMTEKGDRLALGSEAFHMKLLEARRIMKRAQAHIDEILAISAKRERGCKEWLEILELKRKLDEGKTAGTEADR